MSDRWPRPSPVRVQREDAAVAELGPAPVGAALLPDLRVQELGRHQAREDLQAGRGEERCLGNPRSHCRGAVRWGRADTQPHAERGGRPGVGVGGRPCSLLSPLACKLPLTMGSARRRGAQRCGGRFWNCCILPTWAAWQRGSQSPSTGTPSVGPTSGRNGGCAVVPQGQAPRECSSLEKCCWGGRITGAGCLARSPLGLVSTPPLWASEPARSHAGTPPGQAPKREKKEK